MSRFKEIDSKLEKLSTKLGANLTKDRPNTPKVFQNFEERRIDWMDNNISKAIIIQPTFESNRVNSEIWNLINIAWYDDKKSNRRIQWRKNLVDKDNFEHIKSNIDDLLLKSELTLSSITMSDLK